MTEALADLGRHGSRHAGLGAFQIGSRNLVVLRPDQPSRVDVAEAYRDPHQGPGLPRGPLDDDVQAQYARHQSDRNAPALVAPHGARRDQPDRVVLRYERWGIPVAL